MNLVRFKVRFEKILFCLKNKKSWKAFLLGVAPAIENLIVLKKTKPDAVIDVGANRGQFTLVSDIVFSGIPIYSFEPIPEEAKIYKRIFSKNKNINFFECALGEEKKYLPCICQSGRIVLRCCLLEISILNIFLSME